MKRYFSLKGITLIAMLSTISIVGRVFMNPIPNVQPTTFIIIAVGFVFGPIYGLTVALLSTIISNMVLGMGLWTVGQVIAWGLIGLISGLIGQRYKKVHYIVLAIYFGFTAYLYGFIMSLWTLVLHPITFWMYYISGLPFDTNHAVGNVIIYLVAGKILLNVLEKQKQSYFK